MPARPKNQVQKLIAELLRQPRSLEDHRNQTVAGLAREIGVSAPFLHQVRAGVRRPGPKVLKYLGLEAYEAYRRAGNGSEGSGSLAV